MDLSGSPSLLKLNECTPNETGAYDTSCYLSFPRAAEAWVRHVPLGWPRLIAYWAAPAGEQSAGQGTSLLIGTWDNSRWEQEVSCEVRQGFSGPYPVWAFKPPRTEKAQDPSAQPFVRVGIQPNTQDIVPNITPICNKSDINKLARGQWRVTTVVKGLKPVTCGAAAVS